MIQLFLMLLYFLFLAGQWGWEDQADLFEYSDFLWWLYSCIMDKRSVGKFGTMNHTFYQKVHNYLECELVSFLHMTAADGVFASCKQESTWENRFLKAVPTVYKKDVTEAQCVLVSPPERQMHANIEIILGNVVPYCWFCLCSICDLPVSMSVLLASSESGLHSQSLKVNNAHQMQLYCNRKHSWASNRSGATLLPSTARRGYFMSNNWLIFHVVSP